MGFLFVDVKEDVELDERPSLIVAVCKRALVLRLAVIAQAWNDVKGVWLLVALELLAPCAQRSSEFITPAGEAVDRLVRRFGPSVAATEKSDD